MKDERSYFFVEFANNAVAYEGKKMDPCHSVAEANLQSQVALPRLVPLQS